MKPSTVKIKGNTFPHRVALKAMGGRFEAAEKAWYVPAERADEVRRLVGPEATKKAWSPCGYPDCNPVHCDDCEGRGSWSGGAYRGESYGGDE